MAMFSQILLIIMRVVRYILLLSIAIAIIRYLSLLDAFFYAYLVETLSGYCWSKIISHIFVTGFIVILVMETSKSKQRHQHCKFFPEKIKIVKDRTKDKDTHKLCGFLSSAVRKYNLYGFLSSAVRKYVVFPATVATGFGPTSSEEYQRLRSFASIRDALDVAGLSAIQLAQQGFYWENYRNSILCSGCFSRTGRGQLQPGIRINHMPNCLIAGHNPNEGTYRNLFGQSPNAPVGSTTYSETEADPRHFRIQLKHEAYAFVQLRVNSFRSCQWATGCHSPDRLAKGGLYYAGVGDKVICHSCRFIIQNWRNAAGPSLRELHLQYLDTCRFALSHPV